MTMDETIFIGVLRLVIEVPGARSLKDRRRAVLSLRDRLRHKFDVTVHEVGTSERPGRQTVVLTTGGNDAVLLRSILDKATHFAQQSGSTVIAEVDSEVFRWHPPKQSWMTP